MADILMLTDGLAPCVPCAFFLHVGLPTGNISASVVAHCKQAAHRVAQPKLECEACRKAPCKPGTDLKVFVRLHNRGGTCLCGEGAKAQTTLCREMTTRFHNGGAQMKRGVRNSRATRQWPQSGGEGQHPRVDFNKMKVSGLSRADLPALSMA